MQGLSGFGFALTAMAIWAWTLQPQLAAVLAVFGALTGQVVAALTIRRGFEWRSLLPFMAGGLAGLPLGLYLLPRLDVPLFKGLLGLLLVVLCPAMFFAARLPRIARGGRAGDALSGAAGGVMAGLGGFAGVVPTLWCQLRGFGKERARAIVQTFNLAMLAIAFVSYLGAGFVRLDMLPLLGVVFAATLLPWFVGTRLYLGISDLGFRQVVLGLLTASGAALLWSAGPELVRRLA